MKYDHVDHAILHGDLDVVHDDLRVLLATDDYKPDRRHRTIASLVGAQIGVSKKLIGRTLIDDFPVVGQPCE